MKRSVHVVGAAIVREGLILCAKRSMDMVLPGKWEFPGGKLEAGESPEEALRREILEELSVEVRVDRFVARGMQSNAKVDVVLDIYICHLISGEPRAEEHDELRWLAPKDLGGLDWAVADLPAVDAIQSRPESFT